VVICLERGADCLHMVQLMPLHLKTPSSLASFKSRLVLPFWYRLSPVFLKKRPLNRCSSSSSINNVNNVLMLLWPGGVMVKALDSRLRRSPLQLPAIQLLGNAKQYNLYRSRGCDALQLGR